MIRSKFIPVDLLRIALAALVAAALAGLAASALDAGSKAWAGGLRKGTATLSRTAADTVAVTEPVAR